MKIHGLKNGVIAAVFALLMTIGGNSAYATQIELDFTATDFRQVMFGHPPSPVRSVSGTIIYEAASPTANITQLDSIDLTVDGHTYLLSEVGFASPFMDTLHIIGGTANGINAMVYGTNDFCLVWRKDSLLPWSFAFSSTSTKETVWTSLTFSSFSIHPVPEPSTMLLLGSGLVGLVGFRRKLRK